MHSVAYGNGVYVMLGIVYPAGSDESGLATFVTSNLNATYFPNTTIESTDGLYSSVSLVYAGKMGFIISVANSDEVGYYNYYYVSQDGLNWGSAINYPNALCLTAVNNPLDLTYAGADTSGNGGVFMAWNVGPYGANSFACTSTDLQTWKVSVIPFANATVVAPASPNGPFYVYSTQLPNVYTSTDGKKWNLLYDTSGLSVYSVGAEKNEGTENIFIVLDEIQSAVYSADGVTFSQISGITTVNCIFDEPDDCLNLGTTFFGDTIYTGSQGDSTNFYQASASNNFAWTPITYGPGYPMLQVQQVPQPSTQYLTFMFQPYFGYSSDGISWVVPEA